MLLKAVIRSDIRLAFSCIKFNHNQAQFIRQLSISSLTMSKAKAPKGMRDFGPEQMRVRRQVFRTIQDIFELHGASEIDTPVLELRETLIGKYGDDSKLIYNLEDQGGEILSMRYDLTVPFARFLAQNKITTFKRYQIGKVYRRDQPSVTKGRFREFYQCDLDIAGNSDEMIADSECLKILFEILTEIKLKFVIKVNHRSVLNGMMSLCGVPEDKLRTICSSIDKLGKLTWEDIKKEMTEAKGLSAEVADKIGHYIKFAGSDDVLNELLSGELSSNDLAKSGLDSLLILHQYCCDYGIEKSIKFDMSLARGLDYYTGVIYEAELTEDGVGVGSIAAGGRYDNLVGIMAESKKFKVPCIGLSIGIERILAIVEKRMLDEISSSEVKVFVASIGKGLVRERLKLMRILLDASIPCEHIFKDNPKLLVQIQYAEEKSIPFVLIIGESEINDGVVKLRNTSTREEITVERQNLIQDINSRLQALHAPITVEPGV